MRFLPKLPPHVHKELLLLTGGAALLVSLAVVLSGSFPFTPSFLKLAVSTVNDTAATANAAAPYWASISRDNSSTEYNNTPYQRPSPTIFKKIKGNNGTASCTPPQGQYSHCSNMADQCLDGSQGIIGALSASTGGSGATSIVRLGGATTVGTFVAPVSGSVLLEWSCQDTQEVKYAVQGPFPECYQQGDQRLWFADGYTMSGPGMATQNVSGGGVYGGSVSITAPSAPNTTHTYRLACKQGAAETWATTISVQSSAAVVNISANPAKVVYGGSSTVTWSSSNTVENSCMVAEGVVGVGSGQWQVPYDWNSANNTIEAIGGGGGGKKNIKGGGGGGAYSLKYNVDLAPGAIVAFNIGASGGSAADGGNSYFCNSTSECTHFSDTSVVVSAQGGTLSSAGNNNGGAGGAAASSRGDVRYSGGNGNKGGIGPQNNWGGGGGGAGGPSGNGIASGGRSGGTGGAGAGGSGGPDGDPGLNGAEWDATHGSGGGAGGRKSNVGAGGGNYGGGGGGGNSDGGPGGPGIIRVRYISTATGQPKVIYFTTSRAPNDNSYQSPFTASGITSARSYTVTCTTPENAIVSKTVTIGILPPVPSISATNGSVAAPPSGFTYIKQSTGAGSVTWAATGAAPNTCSVAGYPTSGTFFGIAPANTNAASGVSISPLAASTTYALMCPAFFTETATIMGGATLAAGRIGQAVSLSSGQMVQVTDLEPLHSDRQLTAAVWIYPTSFVTAWQNIVWKGNLSDCTTGCENREYAMWINSAGYIHAVSTSVNNIGISQTVCNTPAGSIALNQWQHVALVVNADAGNIKVYINGAEQASCPYSTSGIRTTSGFFGIGGSHGGGSFTGLIDDVRIYNRALTVAEVDTLNKAGTITSGQKAHFTFDTNFVSGTTASGAFSSSAQVAVVPPTCQDSTSLSCSWQCNTGLNSAQVYDDNQPSVSWCCPANFGETGATITGPNGFSLARPASGTYVLPPGGGAYSVTCNPSGSAGSASYSVLAETSADLRVVGRTRPNTKPILQYKINGIGSNTCTLTGRGVSLSGLGVTATGAYVTAPAGSLTITRPEKYTLTCSDGVGTKSWTATANILPSLIEI